jgi:hypothetical protein
VTPSGSYDSSSLNDSNQHGYDGDDDQDVNKATHRIACYQAEPPQNQQYYRYCPQHISFLSLRVRVAAD